MWRRRIVVAAAMAFVISTQHVQAQKKPDKAPTPSRSDVTAFGAAVTPKTLDTQRGGQAVVVNAADLDAMMQNNRAIDNTTGNNYISDGAFSHSSGLPVVIQNSGNNVILQNSLILNLQMK
jgi:hypothetical protein